MNDKQIVGVFKALGDENRIKILRLLQGGEKCACKILEEMQITQPTLSHHVKILCDSGLVQCRKQGKWVHYSLSPIGAQFALRAVEQITCQTPHHDGSPSDE